jgi:hypothetical protein
VEVRCHVGDERVARMESSFDHLAPIFGRLDLDVRDEAGAVERLEDVRDLSDFRPHGVNVAHEHSKAVRDPYPLHIRLDSSRLDAGKTEASVGSDEPTLPERSSEVPPRRSRRVVGLRVVVQHTSATRSR